jgi:CheY-like chemotaxis protein
MSMIACTTVPARQKLVVVEDDHETRELELFLLSSEGYQTIGVPDGEHAAEAIRDARADLVILDLMLPHKDGFEILRELQAEPLTANTPVIVVSAYVGLLAGREAELARMPQVRRVLRKPFDVTELLDAIVHELGAP